MEREKWKLNKSQRMQIKALICVLGVLLIMILLIAKIVTAILHSTQEETPEIPVPVITLLHNVWIMETGAEELLIFREGVEESYPYADAFTVAGDTREQMADIELTDGAITGITLKTEKVNARVLSADASTIELEGYGRLPLTEDYKGYRIYNSLAMCTVGDLAFGYDFADFVMENGSICGILMVKEEAMEYIRVLIKASDYTGTLHEQVALTANCAFTLQYGSYDDLTTQTFAEGEELIINGESPYFSGDRITVTPDILTGRILLKSVNRSQGIPSYRGTLELISTREGIAVVNQVPLEEYLYSVVPSEMPASYPEEALKAQAICARTYAYGHMQRAGYPMYGAHVDDSTTYQVYNNILEQESTTTAAKDTYGQLLYTAEGELAETYYYSTSCGVGTDATIWKTEKAQTLTYLQPKLINRQAIAVETGNLNGDNGGAGSYNAGLAETLATEEAFASYITTKNAEDFEVSEGWYRWSYQVKKLNPERIFTVLQKRYEANNNLVLTLVDGAYTSQPIEEFTAITELSIAKRGRGGIADELIVKTTENTYKVISEHNIRYVLNNGESAILRQDGSEIPCPTILPSAFFILTPSRERDNIVGYTLTGGGFGHGVGMSQNGARSMAGSGYSANDILLFFYENCSIQFIYGED